MICLTSDNWSSAHPEILASLNLGDSPAPAYGSDSLSQNAREKLASIFATQSDAIAFCLNGSGANLVTLSCLLKPYDAVIGATSSHVHVDECGALERITGSKFIGIPKASGKLSPDDIRPYLHSRGDIHRVQIKVVTIAQPTETGTVYSLEELQELASFCRSENLDLHVDGARLSNALAEKILKPSDLTQMGIAALTLGGVKNGLLFGEVAMVFDPLARKHLGFMQKQCLQLHSKNRYIAAQYLAWLEDDLWLKMARHANQMAQGLGEILIPHAYSQTLDQGSNALFCRLKPKAEATLREIADFYTWDPADRTLRLMCSWATQPEELQQIKRSLQSM